MKLVTKAVADMEATYLMPGRRDPHFREGYHPLARRTSIGLAQKSSIDV